MKPFDAFAILLLAVWLLVPTIGAASDAPAKGPLRYRFTAQPSYKAGAPITVGFELTNVSSQPVWVLPWYTPLEGLWGKILKVTRDGQPVQYRGPMAKRGPIHRDDYVRLDPGKSVKEEVDLSQPYDLSAPGSYSIDFIGPVRDVSTDEASLPRGVEAQQSVEIKGDAGTFKVTAK